MKRCLVCSDARYACPRFVAKHRPQQIKPGTRNPKPYTDVALVLMDNGADMTLEDENENGPCDMLSGRAATKVQGFIVLWFGVQGLLI